MPGCPDFLKCHWRKKSCAFSVLAILLLASRLLAAPETNPLPVASGPVITNLTQFWVLPAEEKNKVHPVRIELLIYYFNPEWNVFWGRSDDLDTFLPLQGIPAPLRSGDRVLFDGLILPVNQEFLWDKTSIRILSRSNALPCVSAEGKFLENSNLINRFVKTKALVDSQVWTTPQVLRLRLLSEDFSLAAFLNLAGTNAAQTDLAGKYVRIKGVYAASFDAFGKAANVTLWTPGLNCIETIGSLETDPRFSTPVVSSEDFSAADAPVPIRGAGQVRAQQPRPSGNIRDVSGPIRN